MSKIFGGGGLIPETLPLKYGLDCIITVHHMTSSVWCSPGLTVLASNASVMLAF